MMKRLTIAALLTFLAVAAAWCPLQSGTSRIARTVAATLIAPVIAAQSADAGVPKKKPAAEPAARTQCAGKTKSRSTSTS